MIKFGSLEINKELKNKQLLMKQKMYYRNKNYKMTAK